MRALSDIPKEELRGKRILVRSGLNVPVYEGSITSIFRIQRALPTLEYLRECGAKVIVLSHLGRDGSTSLQIVSDELHKLLPHRFVPNLVGGEAENAVKEMSDGDVLLLENVRSDSREEANNETLAKELAQYGDMYVNDAFAVSHREHASIVSLPKELPSAAGLGLMDEINSLRPALEPAEGALCIIGGAKFDTKEPLIEKELASYAHVYVCGALANDIFKAKGYEVGASRISDHSPSESVLNAHNLRYPKDITAVRADGTTYTGTPDEVQEGDRIVDLHEESFKELSQLITEAPLVLWNGPTGIYEEGFSEWSRKVASAIAESGAQSIVGGGDTVSAIEESELLDKFTFVSTGGGAMLEYLLEGTLPGIDALK